jgi:hypothetical protein
MLGPEFRVVSELQEGVQLSCRFHEDGAASSTVATGWPAARHKFFPPERCDAISSIPALYDNPRSVQKLHLASARMPNGIGTGALRRINANELALPPLLFELHDARNHREQCIVRTSADVRPRLEPGPSLADQNLSAQHGLTAESFHSKPL